MSEQSGGLSRRGPQGAWPRRTLSTHRSHQAGKSRNFCVRRAPLVTAFYSMAQCSRCSFMLRYAAQRWHNFQRIGARPAGKLSRTKRSSQFGWSTYAHKAKIDLAHVAYWLSSHSPLIFSCFYFCFCSPCYRTGRCPFCGIRISSSGSDDDYGKRCRRRHSDPHFPVASPEAQAALLVALPFLFLSTFLPF